MSRLDAWAIAVGANVSAVAMVWYLVSILHAQTAALEQIAASLQGKPPVQVTAVVDLGAGAKQTLEDALRPETKGRKGK